MTGKNCGTCLCFEPYDDKSPKSNGQCRRYPPSFFYDKNGEWHMTVPDVDRDDDWCWEHKPIGA